MTQNVALAGAVSIGVDVVSAYEGRIDPECVVEADLQIYTATDTPNGSPETSLIVGGGVSKENAPASLRNVAFNKFEAILQR